MRQVNAAPRRTRHCKQERTNHTTDLTELEKGCRTLCLLLLAMNGLHWDVDVIEKVRIVLNGIAGRAEDHSLTMVGVVLEK